MTDFDLFFKNESNEILLIGEYFVNNTLANGCFIQPGITNLSVSQTKIYSFFVSVPLAAGQWQELPRAPSSGPLGPQLSLSRGNHFTFWHSALHLSGSLGTWAVVKTITNQRRVIHSDSSLQTVRVWHSLLLTQITIHFSIHITSISI